MSFLWNAGFRCFYYYYINIDATVCYLRPFSYLFLNKLDSETSHYTIMQFKLKYSFLL